MNKLITIVITILLTSMLFIGCKEKTLEDKLLIQREDCIDHLYYDRTHNQDRWERQIHEIDSVLVIIKTKK